MSTIATEKLKTHYDSVAGKRRKYLRRNKYYHRSILKFFRMVIPKGATVLELGCATGDLIGKLESSHGVGVDISSDMITLAKEKYPQISFRKHTGTL